MEPMRLRASGDQFSCLLDFMERHGDISKPLTGPNSRVRGERQWRELTSLLNSVSSGVAKSLDKWKKVWADWKTKTKRKYVLARRLSNQPGGEPDHSIVLTFSEQRLLAIMGMNGKVGQISQPRIASKGRGSSTHDGCEEVFIEIASPPVLAIRPSPASSISSLTAPPPAATPPRPEETSSPSPPSRTAPLPTVPSSRSPRRTVPSSQSVPRRNRIQTPYERVVSEFAAIERRRLQIEELREKNLHEREMDRIRLESERIQVAREHNELMRQFGFIAQSMLDVLGQNNPSNLVSTVFLPDSE